MNKFLLIKLTSDTTAKFFCPHCKKLVLEGSTDKPEPLPSVCPICSKTIDNTGVTPYPENNS